VTGAEKTYTISKTAEVTIDDGRGRRFSVREAKIGELIAGCMVSVKLSPDQKQVVSIHAEGPTMQGVVKAIDAGKQTITLTMPATRREEPAVEQTFMLAVGGEVVMEDERPRRFFPVREAKLGDVPVGAVVTVKLSPDQASAVSVHAEGPSVSGALKGIDAGKGTVIIVIGGGRGTEAEEKSYTVAKDAKVWVDGVESKFADLKVSDPPAQIGLKLSLDQKSVKAIHTGRGGR
jgi:hypothetical protein